MAQVTYQTSSSVGWNSPSTSNTVDKPTGTTEGDLLITVVGISDNAGSGTPVTTLAGWTAIAGQHSGLDGGLYTYYKVAGASEPTTYTWSFAGSLSSSIGVLRIDGQETGTPTIVSDNDLINNTANPTFTGGVTPATVNNLLVFALMVGTTGGAVTPSSYAIATDNPTWTENVVLTNQATNQDALAISVAERTQATATGNYSVTVGGTASSDHFGQLIAIPIEPDVTVNVDPLIISGVIPNATVTADANVTVTPLTASSTLPDITVTAQENTVWTLESKPSDSIWTNEDLIQ